MSIEETNRPLTTEPIDLSDANLAKALRDRVREVCILKNTLEQRGIDVDLIWYQKDSGENEVRFQIRKTEYL